MRVLPRQAAMLANTLFVWAAIGAVSFPMLWALLTSVKPKDEVLSFPVTFWPEQRKASTVCPICWSVNFRFMFQGSGRTGKGYMFP